MKWSDQLKNYAERFWQERRPLLKEVGEKADSFFSSCSEEEALLVKYTAATLPLSDLADYTPEFLLSFVKSALKAREEFPWCAALPEPLFLLDVLYPRINNEELADCRGFFHDALADRVRGLSLVEAILEVNRWCAEKVTYRSTDDRTASPLTVYTCGYGRCGEESAFAVNALRSVGIAARQVYAPWWSHCDDNHAWVEVYDGACWRYLGACEPEPELDRGWFTGAASRAMMIHARTFLQGERKDWAFLFPDAAPADLWKEQDVVYENVVQRYGKARLLTAVVRDRNGNPVSGARVTFSVLNMAKYSKIAVLKTGQDGAVRLRLGLGSVLISAAADGSWGEVFCNTAQNEAAEIVLSKADSLFAKDAQWQDLDFAAPAGAADYPAPLSPEKKRLRRDWLDAAALLREDKMKRAEKRASLSAQEELVWNSLTEKDKADSVRESVLLDSLQALTLEGGFPEKVFQEALLCPRIGTEPLAPWREELAAAFSPEEQENFREDPCRLWGWLEKHVRDTDSYLLLQGTIRGAFRLRAANKRGREALFCALCRAAGIPARLSPVDGRPEFYGNGEFRPAAGEEGSAAVLFRAPEGQAAQWDQNTSLSRFWNGMWETVVPAALPAGGERKVALAPGLYRVLTVSRMPGGNQLARQIDFCLKPGEVREVSLSFREGRGADMLDCRPMPPFVLEDGRGEKLESVSLLRESPFSLLFWLEPGREPTEHILNELRESAPAFAASGCALHFILEDAEQEKDFTLKKALAALPGVLVWRGDFQDDASQLARQMFCDPDKLPLILLADSKGDGLYSACGYNVGTAALLLRLLSELQKN